jgi:hypothetical protein
MSASVARSDTARREVAGIRDGLWRIYLATRNEQACRALLLTYLPDRSAPRAADGLEQPQQVATAS